MDIVTQGLSPWNDENKALHALYNASEDLPRAAAQKVASFIKKSLPQLAKLTTSTHIRPPNKAVYPFPLEVTPDGQPRLLLKKYGRMHKEGGFRKAKLAVAPIGENLTVVVHSTERIVSRKQEENSTSEIRILQKISSYLDNNPAAEGLLKFYSFIDYSSKKPKPKTDENGYDEVSSIEDIRHEIDYKRAIVTKFYSLGNLQENLSTLELDDRIEIARQIFEGIRILHEDLKIIHFDLKLDNIFLNDTEEKFEAVIGDFGFGCEIIAGEECYFKNGHKKYRAPEFQPGGASYGQPLNESHFSADIFSMGLLLKELLHDANHSALEKLIIDMTAEARAARPLIGKVLTTFNQIFSLKKSQKITG